MHNILSGFLLSFLTLNLYARHDIQTKYLDLPELETEHLILRKFELSDARDLYEFSIDHHIESCDPNDMCLDQQTTYLKSVIESYQQKKPAPWALFLKKEEKVIGYCGLFELDTIHARCRIGFGLSPHHIKQVYLAEALQAVIDFLFMSMKVNRIEARTNASNLQAIELLDKVGMLHEGTFRQFEFINGDFQDIKLYAVIRGQYIKHDCKI